MLGPKLAYDRYFISTKLIPHVLVSFLNRVVHSYSYLAVNTAVTQIACIADSIVNPLRKGTILLHTCTILYSVTTPVKQG